MKNEREISLKGLIIYIFQHWRSIIIGIIVGGLILLAFGFYKSTKNVTPEFDISTTDLKTPEEVLEEMLEEEAEADETPLSEVERSTAYTTFLNIINYYEGIGYVKSTPYMQIDGTKAPQATLSVSLSPSVNENNSAIVYSYKQLLLGGELHKYISRELGLKIENWERLISVSDNINSEVASVNGIFVISVVYTDEKTCHDITESVIAFLNEKQPELVELYGYFDINIIDNGTEIVYSSTIINAQRDRKTATQNYYSTAVNAMSSFTKNQLDYYDELLDNADFDASEQKELVKSIREYMEEARELSHEEAMKKAEAAIKEAEEKAAEGVQQVNKKKYLLIGLLLGAFVMVVIHAARYIFGNRTDIYDDVQSVYGVTDLGHIPADETRKRLFSFVDRWILKWRNRTFKQTRQDALNISAVGINALTSKNQVQDVAILTCRNEFAGLAPEKAVSHILGERVENAIVLENILDDAAAMNRLSSSDSAVIVSQSGVTSRNDIARVVDIVNRQGLKLLGAVTAD